MRRGVFGACEFGLLFERFSLGPPYEEFQKMADFGVLRNWPLLGIAALLEPRFAAECCPMIAL